MHYWPPALLIIMLSAVMFLSSGCMNSASYKRANARNYGVAPPPHEYKPNPQFEEIKNRNYSVVRTEMVLKGMSMHNPMFIRAFKSEMQLELWVQSSYSPQYRLFKTYKVCNKSGALGPKLKEGDLQTPEGFYETTPNRLNPNSKYFLSFNIGFPNKFDKSLGRTGSHLMIHGKCVSQGCLAMDDKNIAEIYLIVEQNFKHGHQSIPIHMFPFKMTPENMLLRNTSRWYPFWENLKQGYDYFEQYKTPPAISTRKGQYIIGAN